MNKAKKAKKESRLEELPKDGSDGHCHTCRKNFNSISDARRHAKEVHKPKKFKCPNCGETFTRQESLTRHVATIHDKTAKEVCSICEVEFVNQDSLRRHFNDVHRADRDYKCGNCPLTFARKDTRDKHETRARNDFKKHGVETKCNQCGESLIFPSLAAYKKQRKNGDIVHDHCPAKQKGVFLESGAPGSRW